MKAKILRPPAWLGAYGLTAADLAPFAEELRIEGNALLARHRDRIGSPVGWEIITPGSPRPGSRYTAGAQGGSWRCAPTPRPRLVLTRGALQAIAVSAYEGGRDDTAYIGLGGRWGTAARDTLTDLLLSRRVREVDHCFTTADADLILYTRVDTHIVGLTEARSLGPLGWGWTRPPGDCWLRALREARR